MAVRKLDLTLAPLYFQARRTFNDVPNAHYMQSRHIHDSKFSSVRGIAQYGERAYVQSPAAWGQVGRCYDEQVQLFRSNHVCANSKHTWYQSISHRRAVDQSIRKLHVSTTSLPSQLHNHRRDCDARSEQRRGRPSSRVSCTPPA